MTGRKYRKNEKLDYIDRAVMDKFYNKLTKIFNACDEMIKQEISIGLEHLINDYEGCYEIELKKRRKIKEVDFSCERAKRIRISAGYNTLTELANNLHPDKSQSAAATISQYENRHYPFKSCPTGTIALKYFYFLWKNGYNPFNVEESHFTEKLGLNIEENRSV